MARNAYRGVGTRQTPQSQKIFGSDQVPNSAGGYAWEIDKWARLERFLVLGSEGGTYYIKEKKLTEENAQALLECLQEDGERTLTTILAISTQGRAIKQDPCLFALAMSMSLGDVETRRKAAALLPDIARTGRMLFTFCEYALQFRSWGPVLRRAVKYWYLCKTDRDLAYQLVKYRQGGGFTHKRLLNVAHPNPENKPELLNVLRWAHGDWEGSTIDLPRVIHGFERLRGEESHEHDAKTVAKIVKSYRLPWEAVPTEMMNEPVVLEALLEDMNVMATIRQLPRLTSVGVLSPAQWDKIGLVVQRLKGVKGAKVHPMQILWAMKTYASGHGYRGKLKWNPVSQIVDALDDAFYLAFGNVKPTNKTIVIGLDVSSSMGMSRIADTNISAREASVAMAMVTAAVEPRIVTLAFSHQLVQFRIPARASLEQMVQETSRIPMGGTNCSLPILEAMSQQIPVEAFIIYTDSETWAGHVHPAQALKQYRQMYQGSQDSKLIVVGMTSNGFSIADPNDRGMLDVVGFDPSVPQLMSDFISS